METKEIKINCPEGFTIDKKNSTFECIKFKPIENKLPKTWEEFCKTNTIKIGESWITHDSLIISVDATVGGSRSCFEDRNFLPNKKYAEAMLALCQLIQLRDCYNNGWVPDWTNNREPKYCIEIQTNKITATSYCVTSKILAFKTEELRDEFLNNFKDLIEVAKPLL